MPTDPEKTRPHERHANVIPIEGWREPMRCPTCDGDQILQVDMVECTYPVAGVRRSWPIVEVHVDALEVDVNAIGEQFYRCRTCGYEWNVRTETRFIDTGESASL